MHSTTIQIWVLPGELRCLMRPRDHGWELSIEQVHKIIKSDVFIDGATAVAAADQWRQQLECPDDAVARNEECR